jgi:hypothetical protein
MMRRLASIVVIGLVLGLAAGATNSPATPSGAYVVVDILRFTGPDCSAAVVDISNQGDTEQPFGWTLTLEVEKLGISQTFTGQQPLAAGASFETIIGTGVTTAGTYHVTISPGEVSGKSKAGGAVLRLPATC